MFQGILTLSRVKTAYKTPRTSQEIVNGMAWHCQKEMKYHHKFSQFTNSQSKKCPHHASQRSAERPGSTKASNVALGEEFVEPLHKVGAPRHHAETGIKQLFQALQVLLGHLKGDLQQTNGAMLHISNATLNAMLH